MKKVIRLTESDLVRIVRRVIKEGVTVVNPWSDIESVDKGDTMKVTSKDGAIDHFKNGKRWTGYIGYNIIQNPRQVQLDQSGAMNVVSFDPTRKTVTFQNGVVIGPA
jgi:hypothetical protein